MQTIPGFTKDPWARCVVVSCFRPGADPERQFWQAEKTNASFFLLPFSLRSSDIQSRKGTAIKVGKPQPQAREDRATDREGRVHALKCGFDFIFLIALN